MGIIKRQTILSSLFAYGGIAVGFVTTGLLLPKFLSTSEVGVINLLVAYAVVLSQLANLGLNSAGTRYFPYFRNYERQHNGFLLIVCIGTLIGFAICALILIALRPLAIEYNSVKSPLFVRYYYLMLPLAFSILFFNILDNYARLLYDTVVGTFLQQFLQRILLLAVVGVYVAGGISFTIFLGPVSVDDCTGSSKTRAGVKPRFCISESRSASPVCQLRRHHAINRFIIANYLTG